MRELPRNDVRGNCFDANSEENKLFSEAGPFGGCDDKISAAYALGLIGRKAKRDLELINKIRNLFAHNVNPVSFDDPEVASRCREIHVTAEGDFKAEKDRVRFVLAIQILASELVAEADPQKPVRPPAPVGLAD